MSLRLDKKFYKKFHIESGTARDDGGRVGNSRLESRGRLETGLERRLTFGGVVNNET